MTDYTKLVEALRYYDLNKHAADAIEELQETLEAVQKNSGINFRMWEEAQAEVERLKEGNEELRKRQTYIDRYGNEWLTSAEDVPNYAYEHGYADGRAEAEAQLPKRGEWIWDDKRCIYVCSVCGSPKVRENMDRQIIKEQAYCYSCGAKMNGEQNVE